MGNLLTALNHILQHARTDDMTQSGLRPLHQGQANIRNAESGNVRRHNMVVKHRRQVQCHVVLCHASLLRHLGRLDLDIHLDEALAKGVDLDEARVDRLVELAELGDEADVALLHVLIRVRADDAAWKGTHGSDDGAEAIN
jgi:hypothetical protein